MVNELDPDLQSKYEQLRIIFQDMGEVVVAMSGGVDSVLLAKLAVDVLGQKALAATADSPSLPRRELKETIQLASQIGIRHQVIRTSELENPAYAANPTDRCYYCKTELFDELENIQQATGIRWVVFGENADDQSDYRPGSQAAKEHHVRAPLKEAGLSKPEIRSLAQYLGLPVWDKPASACLASRIPYGEEVTAQKLTQIEAAEDFIRELGIRGFRVRHHGEIARIEAPLEQMGIILENSTLVNEALRKIGFKFVTLDLGGYRRGSFDEGLTLLQVEMPATVPH
jgi:pyridinium-3,5-biscarboxylic acid mononucleotide sulfurtransferase